MGHIYFTRHGQTVWNVENKICGMTDIELTELGHRQAERLGLMIKEKNIQIFIEVISFASTGGKDVTKYETRILLFS